MPLTRRRRARRSAIGVALAVAAAAAGPITVGAADAAAPTHGPRVELRVLVVDDGGPSVASIVARLDQEGVPRTVLALGDPARPTVDDAFLAGDDGGPVGRFQGVVLPDEAPPGLPPPELDALHRYERRFGVRQVDAFAVADAAVGAGPLVFQGPLDGRTAAVTAAGRLGSFAYLAGPVPFEDRDPLVNESYGYLAEPLADGSLTPLVDIAVPGDATTRAPIVAAFHHDGRDELVMTFAHNASQHAFQLLAPGVVDWLTEGVHLGLTRHVLTVHIDDVFLTNGRWDTANHCTATETCPPGVTQPLIRMTAADVEALVTWQRTARFRLDLAFNGGGSDAEVARSGHDGVLDAFAGHGHEFHWLNHTLNHPFLGCERDVSVVPWVCTTDGQGQVQWMAAATIEAQVAGNLAWATAHGIAVADPAALVTGEHSGLFVEPQQPVDNPNLAVALAATGVDLVASDASRDPSRRPVGAASTQPRWPLDLYHDVGTAAELVAERNWRLTSTADGGSGDCTTHPATMTCVAPIDPVTGFTDVVVPAQATFVLQRVLADDARPFYGHQDNLAEERLLYPVLDEVLARYRAEVARSMPLLQPTYRQVAELEARRAAWLGHRDDSAVHAWREGPFVHVDAPDGVVVPVTLPVRSFQLGCGRRPVGLAYGTGRSGWFTPGAAGVVFVATAGRALRLAGAGSVAATSCRSVTLG